MMNSEYSALDSALDDLSRFGPESARAGANHAPMVAETLCAMGRADAIPKWLAGYERRLDPRNALATPIAPGDWSNSLGHFNAYSGWVQLFDRELSAGHWNEVVRRWVPRLSRGIAAAAFHGLLRTAHAVRALNQNDTAQRRHELAEGLAYWSARYFPLPEAPTRSGVLRPSQAIQNLPTLPASHEKMAVESMMSGLLMSIKFQPFSKANDIVDVCQEPAAFLSDLARASAGCLVANRNGFTAAVTFIHCVTGTSAVRLLIPYLDAAETQDLLRYCWQVVAGLYVAFGPAAPEEDQFPARDLDTLAERAVQVGVKTTDPHAIKFVEACERENRIYASPVYGAAANLAIDLLSGSPT